MIEQVLHDLRDAARSLRRQPLVTAVAIASLALGIGVNTTIFSVFERLFLRDVNAPAVGDIVNVITPGPKPGGRSTGNAGGPDAVLSLPLFRDLERLHIREVAGMAAHRNFSATLFHDGRATRAEGLVVSGGYFPTLGLVPALGRLLVPADDRAGAGQAVVVLSHRYWMNAFSADRRVIGESLVINGEPMTIVGVAAEGFTGTVAMDAPQVFAPLAMAERLHVGSGGGRRDHWLYVFARLPVGVTRERAQAALDAPFTALIRDIEYPVNAADLMGRAREQFLARRVVLEDGRRMRVNDPEKGRLVLGFLLAVTGLVLLIACANVSTLLLAKAGDRSREMAVRLSLGATPARLLRTLLVESCMLGSLGGLGALWVAEMVSAMLINVLPARDAATLGFELNTRVALYALGIGMATTLAFGPFPTLYALRLARHTAANANRGRMSSSRGAHRFRASLATAQVGMATTLVALAGLFITSLVNVAGVDLGFEADGIATFQLDPYQNGYTPERAMTLFDRIGDELRHMPGVVDASVTTVPLFGENRQRPNVLVEGFAAGPDMDVRANFGQIGDGYFRTLGIPVVAGREFSRADRGARPTVAIVNEAFARKFRLEGPIGKHVALAGAGSSRPDVEIVGLVADAKYTDLREPPPPQLYFPYRQGPFGPLTFYVKSALEPPSRDAVATLVARIDPHLPIERFRSMDEQIWNRVTRDRVLAILSSWFAALATGLAALGLYALLAFAVAQRVKEIGIRVALGARSIDVCRLVFSEIAKIAAVGAGIGIAVALIFARLGAALLFGVGGSDPTIVIGTAGAVAVVVILAAAIPTRRALRVAPVVALRAD